MTIISPIISGIISPIVSGIVPTTGFSPLTITSLTQWLFGTSSLSSTEVLDNLGNDTSRKPQAGRCYEFDGVDDYVEFDNLALTGEFTIFFRLKYSSTTGQQVILGDVPSGTSNQKLAILNGNYFVRVVSSSDTSIAVPAINVWQNIALTRDSSNVVRLYINGTENTLFSGASQSGSFNVKGVSESNNTYGGHLQNFQVFNAQLTSEEIFELSNNNYNASPHEILLKCDEGAGSTAYDSSGNGNHGTITNATLSTFHATDIGVEYSYQNEVGYSNFANFTGTDKIDFGSLNQDIYKLKIGITTSIDYSASSPSSGDIITNLEGNSGGLYLGAWTGSLTDEIISLGIPAGYRVSYASSSDTLEAGYHNVEVRWNGSGYDIYLDDVQVNNVTSGTASLFTGADFILGLGKEGNAAYAFAGQMHYVEIYDNADDLIFKTIFDINSAGNYIDSVGSLTGVNTGTEQGYTPRNESDTTNDVLGNPLQYSGQVAYPAKLVESNCGTFDGINDYLTTGYTPSQNTIYLSYRFKNSLVAGNDIHWGFYSSSSDAYNLFFWGNESGKYFGFNTWSGDSYGFSGVGILDDTEWHHVVAKFVFGDYTSGQIWVDGVERSLSQLKSTTNSRSLSSQVLSFSREPSGFGQKFEGFTCDLKVYSSTLTNSQVNELVESGYINSVSPDIGLPFSEGAGTTIYDVSGNSNHGTATNITESAFWANTQDVYHYNILNGFSKSIVSQGAPNGSVNLSSGAPWVTLCFNFSSPQNVSSATTGVFFRMSSGSLGVHTDGRIYQGSGYDGNVGFSYNTGVVNTQNIIFEKSSSSGKMKVYKDGIYVGESASSFVDASVLDMNNGWSSSALGVYRDVLFYNRELTSQEKLDVAAGNYTTDGLSHHFIGAGDSIPEAYIDQVGSITATQGGAATLSVFYTPKKSDLLAFDETYLTNPAGNYHNNAETKIKQYDSPAMRLADTNNYWFNGSTINAKGYSDIVANVNSDDKIFADVSTANQYKNILSFDEALTGSDLTKVETFTNQ